MTAYLLAIDGGSQSTKVSVLDEAGAVHAVGRAGLRPYELGPRGDAVHPADDLWDTLVTACREATESFGGRPEEIVGIGLCGIRFCRALMDDTGRLTEPVLSWMDDRVARPLEDVDDTVATVGSAAAYLTQRLTGQRRDSAAAYQGMWPIDPVHRDWSTDPAEQDRTGMPRRLLPELVDPGDLLGAVTTGAAAETGLPVGCPVYATANDKAVEALGAGLTEPGTVLLSLGTYVAAMTMADGPDAGGQEYWVNAAAVPGRYLAESTGIRRGMWTVSWLRDLLAPGVDPGQARAWLDDGAAAVAPGSDGLFTLPDWLAPGDAPWRRGAILGLSAQHGPHHLHRAVLEGIVLTMRRHTEAMTTALALVDPHVVVAGGGSRSDLMMQMVADAWGRPVTRSSVADAAGLGAAICAAVGSGLHPGWDAAVAAMVGPGEAFTPDAKTSRRYDEVDALYRSLPGFTDPMFQRIASGAP